LIEVYYADDDDVHYRHIMLEKKYIAGMKYFLYLLDVQNEEVAVEKVQ
jgi:hypothetical protein